MERKKRSGIQLCYPLEERRLTDPKFGWAQNFPVICQPKLDGVRCRALCNGTQAPVLLSSTETQIESVPHINDAIRQQCLHGELDGELYIHGENFETINGIVSRTVNIHEDYDKIKLYVFDVISGASQLERLVYLELHCNFKSLPIKVVPYELAYSFQDIMSIYEKFLDLEYEGIIVRHKLAPYVRKRSTYVLKFKPKKSDVYKIVGVKQMIGREGLPKPLIGALICTSDEGTEFSVGSGMNERFRKYHYHVPQDLIGRYCKISYQHMTAKGSPRFPIFVSILDENPEEDLDIETGVL